MAIKFFKDEQIFETECYRNLNLLAHAQILELDIGSRCGGHGKCGGDRVQVTSCLNGALSPPTESEKEHLSPEDLAQGWRLACQCWPNQEGQEVQLCLD